MAGFGVRLLGAVLAALLSIAASGAAQAFPRPETFTLANGMEVVVITDRRAPVVTHMVWYRVGAADEQAGKTGLAHYLEHLMFKGTRTVGPGEFDRIVSENGGEHNAFTSLDFTAYYQRISRDRLPLVLRLEADRMRGLNFDAARALPERDVIVEERRQRIDNSPGARLSERMMAVLRPNHPYGRPVIGWLHEIQSLTYEDALAWYRRWYAPNNAVLVVAGDIDAAELRPLVEDTYGRLRPNPALPPRVWTEDPPHDAPRRVSLADPKVRQPSLTRFYVAPSYGTDTGLTAHALDVAIEVLGGSQTSRLYRALVEDQKIAVAASASASLSGLGGGRVSVSATPAAGVTLETLEAAVDAVIAEFVATGPTAAEAERARNQLAAAATYARDSQEQLGYVLGASLLQGETIGEIVSWPEDIRGIDAAAALAAARPVLRPERSVTGWLLPSAEEIQP